MPPAGWDCVQSPQSLCCGLWKARCSDRSARLLWVVEHMPCGITVIVSLAIKEEFVRQMATPFRNTAMSESLKFVFVYLSRS